MNNPGSRVSTAIPLSSSAKEAAARAHRSGPLDTAARVLELYRQLRLIGSSEAVTIAETQRRTTVATSAFRVAGGFAFGVATGLMFAPSSGKELRKHLFGSMRKAVAPTAKSVVEEANRVAASAENAAHIAEDGAAVLAHKLTETAEHAGHTIGDGAVALAQKVSEKADEIGKAVYEAAYGLTAQIPLVVKSSSRAGAGAGDVGKLHYPRR
jgi:gas vesicle protein